MSEITAQPWKHYAATDATTFSSTGPLTQVVRWRNPDGHRRCAFVGDYIVRYGSAAPYTYHRYDAGTYAAMFTAA